MVVSFNLQNFIVIPIDCIAKFNHVLQESYCIAVVIFHVPKEHMKDMNIDDNKATAFSKHAVECSHLIDWDYKILQIETYYHECKFIE